MKIKIFEKELDLHYSFRMMLMYEQVKGQGLDPLHMTTDDIVILFYGAVVSTLQYNHITQPLSYIEYMNWLDDNGGEQLLVQFSNWYVDVLKMQYDLVPKKEHTDEIVTQDVSELEKNA